MTTSASSLDVPNLRDKLYERNYVLNLSDAALIKSVNGFNDAVIDVFPISVSISSFMINQESEIDKSLYTGQTIPIDLPGIAETVFLKVNTLGQVTDNEHYTYSGIVEGYRNSSFVLTMYHQMLEGQIVVNNQLYNINFISDGENELQTLTWIDRALIDSTHFLNDTHSSAEKKILPFLKSKVNKAGGQGGTVRVLFLYGSDVNNPLLLTNNIVNKMNTVFTNSHINKHKISVADIEVMNTDFGTDCREKILEQMLNSDPPFTDLLTKVSNTYADMVVVVAKGDVNFSCPFVSINGRIGGIAKLYNENGGNSDNRFTNFSDNYALGDLTAIHEMGHVFGGLHDKQTGTTGDPYPWSNNQAIVAIDETEHTVMGGIGGWFPCDFIPPVNGVPQPDCTRIEAFSNTHGSMTFTDGSPVGSATRNNTAYFKSTTLNDIVSYRNDPPAPTTAPTLSVTNLACFGDNLLEWNEVNLANNYEVYRSTSSSFTNPVRIYDGLVNSLFATYGSVVYYRVKACNEGGCSGYSNQQTGVYINGCQ